MHSADHQLIYPKAASACKEGNGFDLGLVARRHCHATAWVSVTSRLSVNMTDEFISCCSHRTRVTVISVVLVKYTLICRYDIMFWNESVLKGQFTPKIHIVPLTCSTVYPSRLFWCGLQSFGGMDVCLPFNIKEHPQACGAMSTINYILKKNLIPTSFSREHDPGT